MKKKILAAILAMSMVVGMTLSVSASEESSTTPEETTTEEGGNVSAASGVYSSGKFEAVGAVNEPKVVVTVPTEAAAVIVNPYGLEYSEDGIESSKTIISPEQTIVSASNVPLRVDVDLMVIKGNLTSNLVIATTADLTRTTTKSIYLAMLITGKGNEAGDAGDYTAGKTLPFTTKSVISKSVIEMPAAGDGEDTTVYFKIDGSLVSTPATTPWCKEDTVKASYKFIFTPLFNTTTTTTP
ncbi:hypothetical protein LJC58_07225 [Lachnospiraceae bacterium OttesenSCG-928-D06]|nr:hypothetical protein [Lachnospiraceae bacterium OttesenSCG-928-D06]